jgi:hypothetical protein
MFLTTLFIRAAASARGRPVIASVGSASVFERLGEIRLQRFNEGRWRRCCTVALTPGRRPPEDSPTVLRQPAARAS